MPKQYPGERPKPAAPTMPDPHTHRAVPPKTTEAETDEEDTERRTVVRTKPAAPAMPDARTHRAADPSEIDDTTDDEE
jgi:hypothetical protein